MKMENILDRGGGRETILFNKQFYYLVSNMGKGKGLRRLFNIDVLFYSIFIIFVIYFFLKEHDFINFEIPYKNVLKGTKQSVNKKNKSKRNTKRGVRKPRAPRSKTGKKNVHEERCREILQSIFGVEFKSIRPPWLKNPSTGKNLEIDCYSSNVRTYDGRIIKLGCEYDGAQHRKVTPFFHKSDKDFEYQVKKDLYKSMICRKRGVILIHVPDTVAYSDLDRYIRMRLRQERILEPKGADTSL